MRRIVYLEDLLDNAGATMLQTSLLLSNVSEIGQTAKRLGLAGESRMFGVQLREIANDLRTGGRPMFSWWEGTLEAARRWRLAVLASFVTGGAVATLLWLALDWGVR